MSNLKATIKPQQTIRVKQFSLNEGLTVAGLQDVDASELDDGAVLIFDSSSSQWQAKTEINKGNTKINGGNY